MEFLYLLEKIRIPGLNEFMLTITTLGEETAFLVIALILFWCVDKYKGYFVLSVGFVGTLMNQFLKLWYRIPRPWVLDKNFTILEQAKEAATGYSFPSGHTQSAVGTFGSIAYTAKKRWVRIVAVLIAALVSFSRMYIGVHTPLDVFVSIAVAVVLIVIMKAVILDHFKVFSFVFAVMFALAVGLLLFVECYSFPADIDTHNLDSGMKNAYTMIGCIAGIGLVYPLEKKYVNFDTKAVWWAQVLKAILGLVVVLAVKEGRKSPLEALFGASGVYTARAVRYFLIVVVAGVLWPMSFRWFGKLGTKK